jgi:hypothetical protein
MLDASIDCEQPAQLKLTLVVQYHVLHASDSEVAQREPAGQVLVLVLVLLEQADQADHAPQSLATQTQGVEHTGYPLWLQAVEYPDPPPLMLLS